MSALTLQTLGRKLSEKRGERGVRETAREIGISHATLSRVERGYLPDLDTFSKICRWLDIDPGKVLGLRSTSQNDRPQAAVHFKKDEALKPETARALADLILTAQRAMMISDSEQ
ncbi:MAG: helix-turn-helix domain-containing protein [Acidiferrobacteraceae bacterium]